MFNPRVHDSVAHIANVTGINLMLDQADQDVGAVTDKLGSKTRAKPNEYLSCLYDGVTAKSLDKGEFIYRIGRTNLGHFVEAARFVRTSIKRDQHANLALRELIDQAQQYIRLLNGEVDSIKRSDARGVRHTLRVTEGGRTLYEMLNSMNNEECELFFNKNRRLLHTAMTDKIVSKNGEMQLKYQ